MNEPVPYDPEVRRKIFALQEASAALPPERHLECPVTHHFAPGMYGREIFIPAGSCVVGKIHKHAHLNNISLGYVKVITDTEEFEAMAPYSFVSTPGTKRVVLAITDTIWTTYHPNPTDTQDLAVIEAAVIAESYTALGMEKMNELGANSNCSGDRGEHSRFGAGELQE